MATEPNGQKKFAHRSLPVPNEQYVILDFEKQPSQDLAKEDNTSQLPPRRMKRGQFNKPARPSTALPNKCEHPRKDSNHEYNGRESPYYVNQIQMSKMASKQCGLNRPVSVIGNGDGGGFDERGRQMATGICKFVAKLFPIIEIPNFQF